MIIPNIISLKRDKSEHEAFRVLASKFLKNLSKILKEKGKIKVTLSTPEDVHFGFVSLFLDNLIIELNNFEHFPQISVKSRSSEKDNVGGKNHFLSYQQYINNPDSLIVLIDKVKSLPIRKEVETDDEIKKTK